MYVFIPAAYVASSVDMEDNTEWFITTNLGTAVKDTIKDYDLAFASAADKFILKGNNNSSLASATRSPIALSTKYGSGTTNMIVLRSAVTIGSPMTNGTMKNELRRCLILHRL